MSADEKSADPNDGGPINPAQVRFLSPDMCRIHLGAHRALHVTVLNERIYGGVHAALVFPVTNAQHYISLIHIGPDGKNELEIGIIRDLSEFPPEAAALIREALTRRYFVHKITRIDDIRWEYGMIALKVDTDKGPAAFHMYWQGDRAVDYGANGKVLIDVDENRYLVEDISRLSPREQAAFRRHIYW
jgi:ATP-binding cassette, subfamily B, bacterial